MYVIIILSEHIKHGRLSRNENIQMTIDQILWCIKAICTASNFKSLIINRHSILISIYV